MTTEATAVAVACLEAPAAKEWTATIVASARSGRQLPVGLCKRDAVVLHGENGLRRKRCWTSPFAHS